MKTKLTAEHAKRVRAEIAECQKKIKREKAISKDLRYEWRIKELQELITKLRGMLVDGFEYPYPNEKPIVLVPAGNNGGYYED